MNLSDYPNFKLALEQVGQFVQDEYKSQLEKKDNRGFNAIASGKLRDSVKYKITNDKNFIYLYLQLEDHWIRVEYDQKWTDRKPPVHDIRIWMRQKGIPFQSMNNKLKKPRYEDNDWKIVNRIFTKGTEGRHFLKKTIDELDKSNWKQVLINALEKDMRSKLKSVFLNKQLL